MQAGKAGNESLQSKTRQRIVKVTSFSKIPGGRKLILTTLYFPPAIFSLVSSICCHRGFFKTSSSASLYSAEDLHSTHSSSPYQPSQCPAHPVSHPHFGLPWEGRLLRSKANCPGSPQVPSSLKVLNATPSCISVLSSVLAPSHQDLHMLFF